MASENARRYGEPLGRWACLPEEGKRGEGCAVI